MFKPEITVASVIEQDGRFLMVEEETEHGITLNQPAGHLEADVCTAQKIPRRVR